MSSPCGHARTIRLPLPSEAEKAGAVCEDCARNGGRWVHLRKCLVCGAVVCCDSSPNRHARRHASEHGHPVIASMEPGERWRYCFYDDAVI